MPKGYAYAPGVPRHNSAWIVIASTALVVVGAFLLWVATLRIPDLDSFEERILVQSTKMYDDTGEKVLYDVHEHARRTVVPFDYISPDLKHAAIAIEDAAFYEHAGVRPLALLRAMWINLKTLSFRQGGSTITQQVIKNALLTKDKKISRKVKEWVLALKLEKLMTKDDILSLYLNQSPYGGTLYGVEEASRAYFGVGADEVSLAEAAYLAALPQAPTYYSPYGSHRADLDERKNIVLREMKEQEYITEAAYEAAKKEEVVFEPPEEQGIHAPHFVMYIKDYLMEKYGEKVLEEGGLRVITTINYELQEKAEEIVKRYALENEKKFNAENAGLVAIDPKTGHIKVMVGSRDYFDEKIDGNFNVTTAPNRQPGSAFKPFVYATAFKEGYTPETVLFDIKTEFSTSCTPEGSPETPGAVCYSPINYDNTYRGPITLRNALAQSVNIPAVKLLYLTGVKDAITTAKDLGIESLGNPGQYGLTLVLGGGEVSVLEMTSAYGVFANKGVRHAPAGILRVENADGEVLEEYQEKPRTALLENVALQISDVLSDNAARAPAFGENSFLNIPGSAVAVKTGTTNNYVDAWIVGYTTDLAVGAWAGNNDNSPMEKRVAGFIVAPLWNAFMQEVLKELPAKPFEKPLPPNPATLKPILRGIWEGGETYVVDKVSGKLATDSTPPELREEKAIRSVHSILYWLDKNNPLGPRPGNPAGDPQFEAWEYGVRTWAAAHNLADEGTRDGIPTDSDDVHLPQNAPELSISGIKNHDQYDKNEEVTFSVSANGKYPLAKIEIFINDVHVGSVSNTPFVFTFTPEDLPEIKKENRLKVVGYDSVMNKGEYTATFDIKE